MVPRGRDGVGGFKFLKTSLSVFLIYNYVADSFGFYLIGINIISMTGNVPTVIQPACAKRLNANFSLVFKADVPVFKFTINTNGQLLPANGFHFPA